MPNPDPLPTLLCLFDGEDARQASCFAGADATWIDRTDLGRCRYVSVAMDLDEPDSGHLQCLAAVVVVRPRFLDGGAERLRTWLAALDDAEVPVDLLADDAPVTFYAWLTRHAPRMIRSFHQDGEVHTGRPSWWRARAERRLAEPDARSGAEDESSTGQFSLEIVKRYLANRHLAP